SEFQEDLGASARTHRSNCRCADGGCDAVRAPAADRLRVSDDVRAFGAISDVARRGDAAQGAGPSSCARNQRQRCHAFREWQAHHRQFARVPYRPSRGMKTALKLGVIAGPALAAIALYGCVTEEIGPTNFHTTAYIERPAPDDAPTSASLPQASSADDA